MSIQETGRAIYGPPNPFAPVTVMADYTSSSVVSPEYGRAIYINAPVGPETGRALYLASQEFLGIAVPCGRADYTNSSIMSPETARADYS